MKTQADNPLADPAHLPLKSIGTGPIESGDLQGHVFVNGKAALVNIAKPAAMDRKLNQKAVHRLAIGSRKLSLTANRIACMLTNNQNRHGSPPMRPECPD